MNEENKNRTCNNCGCQMESGYYIETDNKYFCCDECLYENYTEEYNELYEENEAYYTEW